MVKVCVKSKTIVAHLSASFDQYDNCMLSHHNAPKKKDKQKKKNSPKLLNLLVKCFRCSCCRFIPDTFHLCCVAICKMRTKPLSIPRINGTGLDGYYFSIKLLECAVFALVKVKSIQKVKASDKVALPNLAGMH